MGTILKYKYSFSTLPGIRRAYLDAFPENTVDQQIMDSTFDQLSAVRNVIIHSAGVCDDNYLQSQKETEGLPKGEKGEKIKLNGDHAYKLLFNCQFTCGVLIMIVDQWIRDNQRPNARPVAAEAPIEAGTADPPKTA